MASKDALFDRQARSYAQYRPTYPKELFKIVLKYCNFLNKPRLALDIATGSGQAAETLAQHFDKVIAIDSSIEQLKQATPRPNIAYQKGLAEETGVDSRSIDLVTVAQALHWFDFEKFFRESHRVLRPGGNLAVWGYGLPECQGNTLATEYISDFSNSEEKMGPYWAPERRHIDEEYSSITPDNRYFHSVAREKLTSTSEWTIDMLIGYLSSWSPYSTFRHKHPEKEDPLIEFRQDLQKLVGAKDGSQMIRIEFPIFIILAKAK